jgi:integrase
MASAVRNERGYWLARWKDATGRWRKRRAIPNTKLTAQALAEELELRARRQLDGLEPLAPHDGGGSVGELLRWWLENYSANLAAHPSNAISLRVHLLDSELARLTLRALRPVDVKAFMDAKRREGLRPRSVNHLRGFLSRAFNAAIAVGRWPGRNPVTAVARLPVSGKHSGDFLRAEEVPRVLRQLHPRWRPLYATALYTAMRKGELLALQREDVDLSAHAILVRRSWDRETTKGGHADAIPDRRRSRALAESSTGPLRERARLSRARRDDVSSGRGPGRHSPSCARPGRHRPVLAPRVPPKRLPTFRGDPGSNPAGLPTVPDEALAEARSAAHPVPRPPPHHRDAAAPLRCSPGRRPEGPPPPRPEAHRGGLRPSGDRLPARRGESAEARGHAGGAQTPGRGRWPCPPRVPHFPNNAEGAGIARQKPERLRPRQRVGETGFEPATPWSRTKCSTRLSHSPRPTPSFEGGLP